MAAAIARKEIVMAGTCARWVAALPMLMCGPEQSRIGWLQCTLKPKTVHQCNYPTNCAEDFIRPNERRYQLLP